jgi:hypothetical protein
MRTSLESLPLSRQQPHPLSTCLEWSALMVSAQNGDRAAYRRLLTEIADLVRCWSRRYGIHGPACEELECNILRTLHRLRHTYNQAARSCLGCSPCFATRRASKVTAFETFVVIRARARTTSAERTSDNSASGNHRSFVNSLERIDALAVFARERGRWKGRRLVSAAKQT